MYPLHGGNNAEICHALHVIGVQVLGMFDSPTQIFRTGMGRKDRFVYIQHLSVCPVTDGVNVDLESIVERDV